MALKIAINGTGRIGLQVAKIVANRDDMEVVAVNTTATIEMLVYLLKYDTIHKGIDGRFSRCRRLLSIFRWYSSIMGLARCY